MSTDASAGDPHLPQQRSMLALPSPHLSIQSDSQVSVQQSPPHADATPEPEGQVIKRPNYNVSPEVMKMHRTYLKAMDNSQVS